MRHQTSDSKQVYSTLSSRVPGTYFMLAWLKFNALKNFPSWSFEFSHTKLIVLNALNLSNLKFEFSPAKTPMYSNSGAFYSTARLTSLQKERGCTKSMDLDCSLHVCSYLNSIFQHIILVLRSYSFEILGTPFLGMRILSGLGTLLNLDKINVSIRFIRKLSP